MAITFCPADWNKRVTAFPAPEGVRRDASLLLIWRGLLLAYAVVGTGLSILIGHRLIGLNYQQYVGCVGAR